MTRTAWSTLVVVLGALNGAVARADVCDFGDLDGCTVSCGKNDQESCAALGEMYAQGAGVALDAAKGLTLLQKACDARSPRACVDLGILSEGGNGVAKDELKARAAYENACEKEKLALGCVRLGSLYEVGKTVPVDLSKAAALFQRACDDGEQRGCFQVARLTELGKGIAKDEAGALTLYAAACEKKHALSCSRVGRSHEGKDAALASSYYQRACDGRAWAVCSYLGHLYEAASPADVPRALSLYRLACEHSDADGCNNLGALYAQGKGIAVDEARAAALYRVACERGQPVGCANLGWAMARGAGVPKDGATALKLVQRACAEKSAFACEKLKSLDSTGAPLSSGAALTKPLTIVPKESCERPGGNGEACFKLASAYFWGEGGVARDVRKGLELSRRACDEWKDAAACESTANLPAWAKDLEHLPDWSRQPQSKPSFLPEPAAVPSTRAASGRSALAFGDDGSRRCPKGVGRYGRADPACDPAERCTPSGKCDPAYVFPLPRHDLFDGELCAVDKECKSGRCAEDRGEGYCRKKGPKHQLQFGQHCQQDTDCASNNCGYGEKYVNGQLQRYPTSCESGPFAVSGCESTLDYLKCSAFALVCTSAGCGEKLMSVWVPADGDAIDAWLPCVSDRDCQSLMENPKAKCAAWPVRTLREKRYGEGPWCFAPK